jgi:hypothetical protein
MDHNYYKISDIYKKRIVLKEFTGNPASTDSKNSYQTTASMMGPGHGPSNASDGQMAVGGDSVMFPSDQELSNSQKAQLLIKFFKSEIDEGSWEEQTKGLFTKLLDHLLGVEPEEEDDEMDEPELK